MSEAKFGDNVHMAQYFLGARIEEGSGDVPAVLYGDRTWTYGGVWDRTRRFAQALREADVRRGERVLIVLPDAPPFVWTLFGTLLRGAVVAMGNPEAPAENIAYLVRYTRATCVVTIPRVAEALSVAGAFGDEVVRVFVVKETKTGEDPEQPSSIDRTKRVVDLHETMARTQPMSSDVVMHRDEPAMWLFTSGSTGEPKANVHSHRDFMFNTEVYAKETVGYRKGDITVSVPRLFFGYATGTNLFFPFAVGATAGLFSERPTPESITQAIEKYQATIVTNVPTMLGKILEHDVAEKSAGRKGVNLSSVRFSLSAGEALPATLLNRWNERFASDVYDGIGSAEMFHIYCSNRPGDVRAGSLGKVVQGYELLVLPEDAKGPGATPCAPGEIGVLWVRGESASHGYFCDRDKSWKTFFGAWCRTGDLFAIDEQGYLYFSGRADDLLKVGGQFVAPVEVEECMLQHPAVESVAVVGIEQDGLVLSKAFVVARGQTHASLAKELQDFVREKLAKYKYPRIVEFVDDLPKNDRGKVDKKALKALQP